MSEPINLRRVRKEKERREREANAAANRRLFGRTKAQKAADRLAKERGHAAVDDKRLERSED